MISSMTAFSQVQSNDDEVTIDVELRSVNHRFLDVQLRLPAELTPLEPKLLDLIQQHLKRGKVELKITINYRNNVTDSLLKPTHLKHIQDEVAQLNRYFPAMPCPTYSELIQRAQRLNQIELETVELHASQRERWERIYDHCLTSVLQATQELKSVRQREGNRLAQAMLMYAQQLLTHLEPLEQRQEYLVKQQQAHFRHRLSDALRGIAPEGFDQITGEELTQRIAQESAVYAIRVDIAEEITRLKSHATALAELLSQPSDSATTSEAGEVDQTESLVAPQQRLETTSTGKSKNTQSLGRRLDFLFQEMNREINTIGSKSLSLENTNAVIEMKLLVEQLREQALNIE